MTALLKHNPDSCIIIRHVFNCDIICRKFFRRRIDIDPRFRAASDNSRYNFSLIVAFINFDLSVLIRCGNEKSD